MRPLLFFLRMFRPHWAWLAGGAAMAVVVLLGVVGLLSLSGWFLTATALAGLSMANPGAFDIYRPGAGVRFFALLRTGGRYGERLLTHEGTFRVLSDLRSWFFRRALPLSPARLQDLRAGDLLNRVVADIDALDTLYLRVLVPSAVACVAFLLLVLVLPWLIPEAAVAAALLMLLGGIALPWIAARAGMRTGRELAVLRAALRTEALDAGRGMAELLVYDRSGRRAAAFEALDATFLAQQARMSGLTGWLNAAVGLTGQAAVLLAFVFGAGMVQAATLSAPQLAFVMLGLMGLFEAVAPLPMAYQYLGQVRQAAERLLAVAERRPAVVDPVQPAPRPRDLHLRFEAVGFRYATDGPAVLQDIDLDLPPGRHVAVTGPSGAGKSTILNLALRFHLPQEGRITLGGVPLEALSEADLYDMVGSLSQSSEIFAATVRENLALGDPAADDAAMWAALEIAGLAEFVDRLPHTLDTFVGEHGQTLSGGEGRRLALARVVLRDPPILLLDEPLAGLDRETAATVRAALRQLAAGRTMVWVTHDLTALDDMDEVVHLQAGRVKERGSHAGLLAADGGYARSHRLMAAAATTAMAD
ncbi:thiol reductant ABC exporter subunit CydC [Marinibaculum pumilum]|uniref:Thiol reductant ABC exporter subunit CydC n=1 Tax=Marinibaculum pumilum TaxID=1766165 RepID=A0ABV7L6E2_9PROT